MSGPTTTPTFINDGNWGLLSLMNVEYEFPFSDVGDNTTFQAYATFRMDKTAYRPRASMSLFNFPLGTAYLTKLGRPRDLGITSSSLRMSIRRFHRTERSLDRLLIR